MKPDTSPYTVSKSAKHPGRWAVFKAGKETRHHRADYDKAVSKAQGLNRRHLRRGR